MTGRNDACPCNSGKKYKKCCIDKEKGPRVLRPVIHTEQQVEKMRAAGSLAARVLNALEEAIKPGISTQFLNDLAHGLTVEAGAESAPLGYVIEGVSTPFPKSICTSINEVVCHGIPSGTTILEDGDIINCDVTVKLDGYHGDTSRTFLVGNVRDSARKLVEVTRQAMFKGIEQIYPGNCLSNIGLAIENFVLPHGYSIVRDLSGHGVGQKFHDDPPVFHFKNNVKFKLLPGMIFTVEPMINEGTHKVKTLADEWTVVTEDRKLSAQFEHTVLVTETSYEILTFVR